MIIRAVSSSDDDDDDAGAHSVFPSSATSPSVSSLSATTAVKLAWIGASLALIALLLLDLAALLNQFFPASNAIESPPPTVDPFTVVAWVLLLWRGRGVASFQPATVLNNLLGQLFVCAWIYARETALAPQRQRSTSRRRPGSSQNLPAWILGSLPWMLVAAVLCLGQVASCGYVLFALFESHGVRTKFWVGRSSTGGRTSPRV